MKSPMILAATLALSTSAWAKPIAEPKPLVKPPGAPAAKKGADFTGWAWQLGKWTCTGTATVGGKPTNVTVALEHKPDLDEHFYTQMGSITSKEDPFAGLKWMAHWTVDAAGMRYAVIDNRGDVESGGGPAGWNGNSYDFTGQVQSPAGKSVVKHNWKHVSEKEFHWSASESGGAGMSWDWTCKK